MATRDAVYAKFGLTAETAQLFETDLGTILLALEGAKQGWHIAPHAEETPAFYEKLDRKSLGQILHSVKHHADLADDVDELFEQGLSARNRLNHGFYQKHNFAIFSEEGREAMIQELETLHRQLHEAWQVSQRISGALVSRVIAAARSGER